MAFSIGFFILFLVVLISIIIYFIFHMLNLKIKKELKIPHKAPILINFVTKKTDGYFIGIVTSNVQKVDKIREIKFVPRDVDLDKIEEGKREVKEQTILALEHRTLILPRGEPSSDREMIFVFPSNLKDIPERFRKSEFGELLLLMLTLKETGDQISDALRIKDIVQARYLKKYMSEELSRWIDTKFKSIEKSTSATEGNTTPQS